MLFGITIDFGFNVSVFSKGAQVYINICVCVGVSLFFNQSISVNMCIVIDLFVCACWRVRERERILSILSRQRLVMWCSDVCDSVFVQCIRGSHAWINKILMIMYCIEVVVNKRLLNLLRQNRLFTAIRYGHEILQTPHRV